MDAGSWQRAPKDTPDASEPARPESLRPKPSGSRSPDTQKPVFPNRRPKTTAQRPVLKGLLLQRSGDPGTSPQREKRHERHTAWTFPSIATGPEAHSNDFPAHQSKHIHELDPLWRLNWLAGPANPPEDVPPLPADLSIRRYPGHLTLHRTMRPEGRAEGSRSRNAIHLSCLKRYPAASTSLS